MNPKATGVTQKQNEAIKRACAEIALVSISFPNDTKSWAKIIKRHLENLKTEAA